MYAMFLIVLIVIWNNPEIKVEDQFIMSSDYKVYCLILLIFQRINHRVNFSDQ